MRMRVVEPEARALERALGLGPALSARAAAERVPWIAGSAIEGPAIVLGALQRAGRVVDLGAARAAGVRVFRRATTGTAAYIGQRGVLVSLALPHVAALARDASPRTLLNRNVRGFLRGFGRAGAAAHYFGREWIAVRHRPAAIVGFDVSPEGTVLIELLAGVDAPIAVPAALATEAERAVDRWLGKAPAALGEVIGADTSPEAIAGALIQGVAAWATVNLEPAAVPEEALAAAEVIRPDDPLPLGHTVGPRARVPIGWLDTAVDPLSGEVWLGGDLLAPVFAVQVIAAAVSRGAEQAIGVGAAPLEGAAVGDLVAAAQDARAGCAEAPDRA